MFHRRPFISRKLIFFGATLWLTSTVLAGVRRATGYTHSALLTPEAQRRQAYLRMLDTRYRHARSLPELRELDQVFIEDAGDPQEKEQRRMWLEKEKERVVQGLGAEHREVFGGPPQWGAAHRGCAAQGGQGFMRWYLGVGERTFDWVVAKVKKSRRFQWQDPTTSYRDLRAAAESTENT